MASSSEKSSVASARARAQALILASVFMFPLAIKKPHHCHVGSNEALVFPGIPGFILFSQSNFGLSDHSHPMAAATGSALFLIAPSRAMTVPIARSIFSTARPFENFLFPLASSSTTMLLKHHFRTGES